MNTRSAKLAGCLLAVCAAVNAAPVDSRNDAAEQAAEEIRSAKPVNPSVEFEGMVVASTAVTEWNFTDDAETAVDRLEHERRHVPEPDTWVMTLLGVAGVAVVGVRRKVATCEHRAGRRRSPRTEMRMLAQ